MLFPTHLNDEKPCPDTGDAANSPKLATAGSVNPVHVTQVSSVDPHPPPPTLGT